MKISEVIRKLKEIQKEHGDIEVVSVFDTYGTGEWQQLEDSGVCFDRYNEDKNVLYIGW